MMEFDHTGFAGSHGNRDLFSKHSLVRILSEQTLNINPE